MSVVDGKTTISFDNSVPANSTYGKTAAELASGGWVDNGNLVVSDVATENHDAARAHLGAPWRMMTDAELQKLVNDCERKCVEEYNGKSVKGYVVSGKKGSAYENNEVFFPAAGYGNSSGLVGGGSYGDYWSSTPDSDRNGFAWRLDFRANDFIRNSDSRYNGYPVRPVR